MPSAREVVPGSSVLSTIRGDAELGEPEGENGPGRSGAHDQNLAFGVHDHMVFGDVALPEARAPEALD